MPAFSATRSGVVVQAAPQGDTEAPVLTLNGSASVTHTLGQSYTDPGANWTDNIDGSGTVYAQTPLDVNTVGEQTLTYQYTDVAGNASNIVTRTVTVELAAGGFTTTRSGIVVESAPVPDSEAPVLVLNGAATENHNEGQPYTDLGADWTDNIDGAGTVYAQTALDVNTLGLQTLTYQYTDAAGNASNIVTRDVTVVSFDATAFTATLSGVQVVATPPALVSVSDCNLGATITIETDGAIDLTTYAVVTVEYGGISLADVVVVDADTITATVPTGGLQPGVAHDVVVIADGSPSDPISKTYNAELAQLIPFSVDFDQLHPDSPYKIPAYASYFAEIVAGDIQEVAATTNGTTSQPAGYAVTITSEGLFIVEASSALETEVLSVDVALWKASDNYSRSTVASLVMSQSVPEGPPVVGTITAGSDTATIPFTFTGSNVTGFQYRFTTSGGDLSAASIVSIANSPIVLSSLTNDQAYIGEVRAVNDTVPSEWASFSFSTSGAIDLDPDPFTIAAQTDVALSTTIESEIKTVLGVTAGQDIALSVGGDASSLLRYRLNGTSAWSAWQAGPVNVRLNNQFQVSHESSALHSDTDPESTDGETITDVTLGTQTAQFVTNTIYDTVPPVVSLIGGNFTLSLGDTWTDPGATAVDAVDGDVTSSIYVLGSVDTNLEELYELTYVATDSAGNIGTATRFVTVIDGVTDTTAPVVSLIGGNQSLNIGDTWNDPGATATDDTDGDLTGSIVVSGAVDTNTAGVYTVTYSATDAAGNVGSASRTVTVNALPVDTTPPVITLNGGSVALTIGDTYTEQGATALDDTDGDVSGDIVITGTVNTNVAGTYSVRYNVSDSAGNAATEVIRTVIVSEAVEVLYDPLTISTDIEEVYLFRDRENLLSVTINRDGSAMNLTEFTSFQLYGLSENPIDSTVNAGAIAGDALGVVLLNISDLVTAKAGAHPTTLVGISSQYPEGIVLWDESMPYASITFNVVDTFTPEPDPDSGLTNGVRILLRSRTNGSVMAGATNLEVDLIDKGVTLTGLTAGADGYLLIQDASLDSLGEVNKVAVRTSDGQLSGYGSFIVEDVTEYL